MPKMPCFGCGNTLELLPIKIMNDKVGYKAVCPFCIRTYVTDLKFRINGRPIVQVNINGYGSTQNE